MPVRQDLYWRWAEATNYSNFNSTNPDFYIQLLIECQDGKSPDDLHTVLQPRGRSQADGFVPALYRRDASRRFCSAFVRRSFIASLPAAIVKRFKLGLPLKATVEKIAEFYGIERQIEEQQHTLTGLESGNAASAAVQDLQFRQASRHTLAAKLDAKVLLAIIDDDINFDHPTFGGRVKLHWDQNTNVSNFPNPPRFGYTLNPSVKALLASKQRESHGTHVASLAGGRETPQYRMRHSGFKFDFTGEVDAASNVPMAGIILPLRTVEDTSGGALAVNVFDALHLLADTRNVSAGTHIITNLSFGVMAGAHDGTSVFDKALDELKTRRNGLLTVVVPAGNSFEAQAHARFSLDGTGGAAERELVWRVLPDDRTPSFLEIWLPKDSKVEIRLVAPNGAFTLLSPSVGTSIYFPQSPKGGVNQTAVAGIIRDNDPAHSDLHQMALLALAPTRGQSTACVPHGDWTVNIKNLEARPIDVRVWIERDNASYGKKTMGRQSYLVDSGALRKPARAHLVDQSNTVTGFGTLNGIACDASTVVVGGYTLKTKAPSPMSAAGSVDHFVRCPDGIAPCNESDLRLGLPGAAHTGGGTVRIGGTSAAAPIATRGLVNDYLVSGTVYPPYVMAPVSDLIGGWGTVIL